MECYKIENLKFTYPMSDTAALNDVSLTVNMGEFITLCGRSGCGKSTLLRHLKPPITPNGTRIGEIRFMGKMLSELDLREQSSEIGFVSQSPDNQIVTDKVWHELAFGLESLGMSTPEIRARVAEMAAFFGIQTWFHKKTSELSGGQKQILCLASIMVMQPRVIILDEPTSQLDPIAAQEFLETLSKIHRELGTTIILSEHRLEEAFAISDRIIVMDNGMVVADDVPCRVMHRIAENNRGVAEAFPTAMRVYRGINAEVDKTIDFPVTVRDGRVWLESMRDRVSELKVTECVKDSLKTTVELKDVWFRYEKDYVLNHLSLKVYEGELFAIVGGNGTGKSTALSVIGGINKPSSGAVLIDGKKFGELKNPYRNCIGVLPQNPQSLFVKKTVKLDLYEIFDGEKMPKSVQDEMVNEVVKLCGLGSLLNRHPYDISGGEQQRLALAKVLLLRPKILLLDEPTKGLDAEFKKVFADILYSIKASGVTVIMVSHDVEFCAAYADRCAMIFDGGVVSEGTPREFFSGKSFYTTSANRMARGIVENAILAEDIISAFGGNTDKKNIENRNIKLYQGYEKTIKYEDGESQTKQKTENQKIWKKILKFISGIFFGALFLCLNLMLSDDLNEIQKILMQILSIICISLCFGCLIPKERLGFKNTVNIQTAKDKRRLFKCTALAFIMMFVAVPFTIYMGVSYFGDRKYYFISMLIIFEALLPFCMMFESRKPQPRELIILSVMCAIGIVGRVAFSFLPQFKPMLAVVIITGICLGGESGFLVGVLCGFVSNFFFGQGPWTPWQMFALATSGLISGWLFKCGIVRKTRASITVLGVFLTMVIYGGIMNFSTAAALSYDLSFQILVSTYMLGFAYDLIHAMSTAFFLWFGAPAMIEKLDRIKIKYGEKSL